jgi:hypothetical protein
MMIEAKELGMEIKEYLQLLEKEAKGKNSDKKLVS